MRKITLLPLLMLLFNLTCFADKGNRKKEAGTKEDSATAALTTYLLFADSVNKAMQYETGKISLGQNNAWLTLPAGFKFLNAEQSRFVINKVWGNPKRDDILGMIMPESNTPFTDSSYFFTISYDDMGYVKDGDAKDIDYTQMLKDMQASEPETNKERTAQGFVTVHIVGWAEQPFYDDKQKVLHWAKEAHFGDDSSNTLNYEVRVLGRKGVLSLTAVAGIEELPLVKKDIDKVLGMASFTPGNRYADYNSGTDKIAAITVGGLVAGAILTKVGFWAVIVKFSKIIIAGIIAAFYAVRKWLTGKGRKKDDEPAPATAETGGDAPAA
jgi:uncharacterized membrane-anchored protein